MSSVAATSITPDSFGHLLKWHLDRGTRPETSPERPGQQWGVKEFAHAVGTSERTLRNWLNDKNSPSNLATIERVLFSDNPGYDQWRVELRLAHSGSLAHNTVTPLHPDYNPAEEKHLNPRDPPVNLDAEWALLGALLSNNGIYDKVADYLRPEHFADPLNGRIYEATVKLIERGQVADYIQLSHIFKNDEALGDMEISAGDYLQQIQENAIAIINGSDYGQTIYELYLRRQLIDVGEDLVNEAFDVTLETQASDVIEEAENRLFQLAEAGQADKGPRFFAEILKNTIEMADAARKRDSQLAGLSTGLDDMDRLLGGLHPSDLLILAGRPAMGKTALATNIAFNIAQGEQASVAFFSLEMSGEQLATRILAEQAQVSSEHIRRGDLDAQAFDRVVLASRNLEELRFFVDDTPAITVGALRARARRLKRQYGLNLIVVDYLQLMRGQGGRNGPENRVQEISEITRGLKAIAKELDVPVIALSQLSRAVEQREDKKPQLADLRESGSIEQDADVVMFVFREAYYLQKAEPTRRPEEADEKFQERYDVWLSRCEEVENLALAIIAKQRHGPVGTVELFFDGPTTSFKNLAREDYAPERR